MRIALASDATWRQAIVSARGRGAELICLPHLSFAPYVAAIRDRAGLENAERSPSSLLVEAVECADGAWLAASAYESEGEGVFYVTSYVTGPSGVTSSYRQREVEASPGRYEQMFWSPGHGPHQVGETPLGPTGTLVGADLRSSVAWADLSSGGARIVLGGSSEPLELWQRTRRVVAGMAAAHGIAAFVVNRKDDRLGVQHPGGGGAFGVDGAELPPDGDGLYEIEAP